LPYLYPVHVVRHQHAGQYRYRNATHGICGKPVHELSPVDAVMCVVIVQLKHFLIDLIFGALVHGGGFYDYRKIPGLVIKITTVRLMIKTLTPEPVEGG